MNTHVTPQCAICFNDAAKHAQTSSRHPFEGARAAALMPRFEVDSDASSFPTADTAVNDDGQRVTSDYPVPSGAVTRRTHPLPPSDIHPLTAAETTTEAVSKAPLDGARARIDALMDRLFRKPSRATRSDPAELWSDDASSCGASPATTTCALSPVSSNQLADPTVVDEPRDGHVETTGKLRLWILSDLHVDVGRGWRVNDIPSGDVAVVAGDVCSFTLRALDILSRWIRPHMPVIFVAGNHEFYGEHFEQAQDVLRRAGEERGITVLNSATAQIGNVRFIGATFWTDYKLFGEQHVGDCQAAARNAMFDHRLIQIGEPARRFDPRDAAAAHAADRAYIEEQLRQPFDGRTVAVTHHAPHRGSIAKRYADDILTAAFVSDLAPLIEAHNPDFWIHGHTHTQFDYAVGKTRIICNPRGYPGEPTGFDPALVIEV